MNTLVLVEAKNVYGTEMLYPANETARTFCEMMGTKTFTDHMIRKVVQLGFTIEQVQQASKRLSS